jgi:flagellar motor protein MotB
VVLLAGGAAVFGQTLVPAEDPSGDRNVANELARLSEELDALQSPEPPATPTADPEADLRNVEEALQDPRWTTEVDERGVAITFDEAIFPNGGSELPESSQALLADAAARIADLEGASVTAVGHTNDIPTGEGSRYADNTELAAEGELPLDEIAIATSGAEDPPYPNTTETDRRRNQTVTLLITPA